MMSKSDAGKLGYLKSKIKREEYFNKFKEIYYSHPKKCKECDTVIEYKKRDNLFCCHSCSATFTNKRRQRNDARTISNCLYCKKQTKNDNFCSSKCNGLYRTAETKRIVLKEKSIESVTSTTGKRIIKEIRGEKCEICGITEWNDKTVPLVMDHIDGNSENNKLTNLRLVCGNCDMQLPTYKSKNNGNGRAYRRKRYKDGKSY